jgi:hypothetical protein
MNGETRMSTFGRKAAVAAVAFATVGSTLFGGVALAGGHGGHGGHNGYDDASNTGGPGGGGGDATAKCFLPIGISLGILGQGGDVSQCNATGGAGGAGGPATADY